MCNVFSQFDNSLLITKFQVLENKNGKKKTQKNISTKMTPYFAPYTYSKDWGNLGLDKSDNFQYFSIKYFVVGVCFRSA